MLIMPGSLLHDFEGCTLLLFVLFVHQLELVGIEQFISLQTGVNEVRR